MYRYNIYIYIYIIDYTLLYPNDIPTQHPLLLDFMAMPHMS